MQHYTMCLVITDGPELLPAAREQTSIENCSVSLVCGYDLDSNPRAFVTWRDPWGRLVKSDDLSITGSGPGVLRLDIANVNRTHEGVWTCNVMVKYSDGSESASLSKQVNLRVLGEFCSPSYSASNV